MAEPDYDPWSLEAIEKLNAQQDETAPALSIETIEGVEPLGDQWGVWPPKTVPDALRAPLFGQPEPTEAEIEHYGGAEAVPPMQTYAILDAAKIFGLPEMLAPSGLEHRCLFKGEAYDEMKDVAPWIVRLEEDNDFTGRQFTEGKPPWCMWGKDVGIYVRSRADLNILWGHFRKFTKVQDENGKWYYWRFWEPAALIKAGESRRRISKLLYSPQDSFVVTGPGMSCIIKCSGTDRTAKVILDDPWKAELAIEHQKKYVRGVLDQDYKPISRTLKLELQDEFSEHLARRFRHYGLQKSYSKEAYLLAAVLLGTRFDRDISYPQARSILDKDEPCYLRMTELKTEIFRTRDEVGVCSGWGQNDTLRSDVIDFSTCIRP